MFDDSLGVMDFCLSNNTAIVYVTEAELVADSTYRCRLVRLKKVTATKSFFSGWLNKFCFLGYCMLLDYACMLTMGASQLVTWSTHHTVHFGHHAMS